MNANATLIARNTAGDGIGGRLSVGARCRSLWTLYLLTLRQHLHGKRWMATAALFLLPMGLAILVRATTSRAPSAGLEFSFVFMLTTQAILPVAALLYASGMIQDEQEEQTITYLLIRPISKWALYLVKLLATVTTTVLLTILFTVLTYLAIYVGADTQGEDIALRCVKAAGIHSLAIVAYCCLFGLISLLTKRALVVGVMYIVIVEGVLANMPFGIRLITVIYYARIIAIRSLTFVVESPGRREPNVAAEVWQLEVDRDPLLLGHPDVITCVITLLAASVACAALGAFLVWHREFHVKTPEAAVT